MGAVQISLLSLASLFSQLDESDKNRVVVDWRNVLFASFFLLINISISFIFQIHLTKRTAVSAFRCVIQLTIMAIVLEPLFFYDHWALQLLMISVMAVFAALEVVYSKLRFTFNGLFGYVFLFTWLSSLFYVLVGTTYVLRVKPFFTVRHSLPVAGMLLGNASIAVSLGIKHFTEAAMAEHQKIEILLAFGGTRWEAALPIVKRSLVTGMLPILNSMALQGVVSIPGMATGQILVGESPKNAFAYQQVVMFMMTANNCTCVCLTVLVAFLAIFDSNHRIRLDRAIRHEALTLRHILDWIVDRIKKFPDHLRGAQ